MTCIVSLMVKLGRTIEAQPKPNLRGVSGLIVRSYLPQVWVFDTGAEDASLVVDNNGNVQASPGTVQPTDVFIATDHSVLSTALEAANGLRSRELVVRGPVNPKFYTSKGRTAFNFLRSRLGL